MRRRYGLSAIARPLALVGAAGADDEPRARDRAAFAGMRQEPLAIEAGGRRVTLLARVAATSEPRAAGSPCATSAEIRETRILFDLGAEIQTQFHMQNVQAALDIAFVEADGRIFAVFTMEPSPTAVYGPHGPFRSAIEARAGFFEGESIHQGAARLLAGAR